MKGLIAYLIFFISHYRVFCQIAGLPTLQDESLLKNDVGYQFQQQYLQPEKFPSSPVINDSLYYLGYGDVLNVLILPVNIKTEMFRVGPDGMIILSRYGAVDLKNITLKEAKFRIEKAVHKQNPNATVFVSLFQPRIVMVNIYGAVLNSGIYALPATYRVSDAINFANQIKMDNTLPANLLTSYYLNESKKNELRKEVNTNGLPINEYYANRNIVVFNPLYGTKYVDLELGASRNSFELNPYIREGDEIYVPFKPIGYETIELAGAVARPGKFPYKPGDKLSDLLKFGLGFASNADPFNIIYFSEDGETKIEVDSNFNLLINDFPVKPNSFLVVGEKSEKISPKTGIVKVVGMVEKPGIYTIEVGKSNLLEVLNQCGKILPDADIAGSYILREKVRDDFFPDPYAKFGKYYLHSNLTMEDSMRFRLDINYRREYVACDFIELLQNKNLKHNLLLEDGDLIVIPQAKKSVFVWGQVKNPGYVSFSEGKDYLWYINQAGGFLPTANSKRTRVIRGIQKIWLPPKGITIFSGDEIYIPRDPDMPPGIEIQYYSIMATVVATLISLTSFIINLSRRN
ncbi:MAG: SLBB domain-containing protein [Candidatus Kapaibacteriales bacterium]